MYGHNLMWSYVFFVVCLFLTAQNQSLQQEEREEPKGTQYTFTTDMTLFLCFILFLPYNRKPALPIQNFQVSLNTLLQSSFLRCPQSLPNKVLVYLKIIVRYVYNASTLKQCNNMIMLFVVNFILPFQDGSKISLCDLQASTVFLLAPQQFVAYLKTTQQDAAASVELLRQLFRQPRHR